MKENFESYLKNFEEPVKELVQKARWERDKFGRCSYEMAAGLMKVGVEEDSGMLTGLAYYFMAEYYMRAEDREQVNTCLTTCIRYLQGCGPYEYVARAYNMLGVIAQSQDNINMSMEYYDDAARYCAEYELDYVLAMVLSNIADSYYRISCYEKALECFGASIRYYEKEKEGTFFWINYLMAIVGKMRCLVELDRKDEIVGYEEGVWKVIEYAENENYSSLAITYAKALMSWIKNEKESTVKYMEEAAALIKETSILESYDNILDYLNLLVKMKRFDVLWRVLDELEEQTGNMPDSEFVLQLLQLRLCHCSDRMSQERQNEVTKQFFAVYAHRRAKNGEAALKGLGLRRELQEIREKQYELKLLNKKLLNSSLHDALTGLPNRGYLNQYSEEAFSRAYKEGVRFGVCLMDIDCFKQLNDRHGHMAGDKCLVAVAEILKLISKEEKIFCARYGGDEFTILFFDCSREEMEQVMKQVWNMVQGLKMANEDSWVGSYVSVSLGGFCRIPKGGNKLWDFMSMADNTLYRVKTEGRDHFLITEEFARIM
ncbi:MAG: GGDEF domain-containing protein [Lachnospiraceae bacterium]|nr:GGDEF domain-containing protein [Lachnospiraceae bacterium]